MERASGDKHGFNPCFTGYGSDAPPSPASSRSSRLCVSILVLLDMALMPSPTMRFCPMDNSVSILVLLDMALMREVLFPPIEWQNYQVSILVLLDMALMQ